MQYALILAILRHRTGVKGNFDNLAITSWNSTSEETRKPGDIRIQHGVGDVGPQLDSVLDPVAVIISIGIGRVQKGLEDGISVPSQDKRTLAGSRSGGVACKGSRDPTI